MFTLRGIAVASIILTAACASTPQRTLDEQLAKEFLLSRPSPAALRGWQNEAPFTAAVLQAMHDLAPAVSGKLLGVGILRTGVHPYDILSFVRSGDRVVVTQTAMSWGVLQAKWTTQIDLSEFERIRLAVSSEVKCVSEKNDELFGMFFIFWEGPERHTCDGGWWTEKAAFVQHTLVAPLADVPPVYEARP